MPNKNLFSTGGVTRNVPDTDAFNEAGGTAYKFTPRHALAQMAHTGTFHDQYYTKGEDQVKTILALLKNDEVDPLFVGRLALHARQRGFMKDMPAFLCAWLTTQGSNGRAVLGEIFTHVIDNAKMLRNFVQFVRSGAVGRKSLGSFPKRLVAQWIINKKPHTLFRQSIGNDPSLSDVIKMVHPKPTNDEQAATFQYLIGKTAGLDPQDSPLPSLVKEYEAWKKDTSRPVPKVPFQMLSHAKLTAEQWKNICENGGWHFNRMNINTFARHKVFDFPGMEDFVADKLRDKEAIANSKVFPYQLYAAYRFAHAAPFKVKDALHDALDIAIERMPTIGKLLIMVDVSYSMFGAAVTGQRGDATSKITALDVAALFGSIALRRNPGSEVIAFSTHAQPMALDPRDTVMTNAKRLREETDNSGTNCSSALAHANLKGLKADAVIYVSDNESWVESVGTTAARGWMGRSGGTQTMIEWEVFKKQNPKAKLINIDTAAYETTQLSDRGDIMNIGGFSDQVFEGIAEFVKGEYGAGAWLKMIEGIKLGV